MTNSVNDPAPQDGASDESYETPENIHRTDEEKMNTFPTVNETADDRNYSWDSGELTVERTTDRAGTNKVPIAAGRYFVGDPCYTAGRDDTAWQKWVDVTMQDDRVDLLTGTYNGYPVIGAGTAYGDGTFYDQYGNQYPVDAGLIGVVSAELIDRMNVSEDEYAGLGRFVDFEKDTVLERTDDGTIIIGDLVIVTGD